RNLSSRWPGRLVQSRDCEIRRMWPYLEGPRKQMVMLANLGQVRDVTGWRVNCHMLVGDERWSAESEIVTGAPCPAVSPIVGATNRCHVRSHERRHTRLRVDS